MLKNLFIKPLILFLLLSQFVTIAHAFEHDLIHEDDEQCFICVHKIDLTNALIDSSTPTGIEMSSFERSLFQNNSFYPSSFFLLKNRDPPNKL